MTGERFSNPFGRRSNVIGDVLIPASMDWHESTRVSRAKLFDRSGQRHWHPDLPIPTIVDLASIDSRDRGLACTDSHEQSEII